MQTRVIYANIFSDAADAIAGWFREPVMGLIKAIYGFLNTVCESVISLLGITPQDFNEGTAWAKINDIMPYFTAVAVSLLCTFFFIGFIRESINIRREFNVENMIKMLFRLGIAQVLVLNTGKICEEICKACGAFATLIGGKYEKIEIPDGVKAKVDELGIGSAIGAMLIACVMFIVAVVIGGILLYTVYFRVYKLLIVIPLGSIAFATVAGGPGLSQTAVSFFKTLIAYAGEVVVMAIAMCLASTILSGGFSFGYSSGSPLVSVMLVMLEGIFSFAIIVAAVKGSETTMRRAFGL